LIDACHPGGTGVAFFTYPFAVACKTGTAETGIEDDTHAWFTVYGPTDDPQIVVTVLVENGGGGSTVAAPIAKKVFDAWFVSQMP
jgi:penicillin-binding protein 2